MAEKNHGPMRGNARGPRPNVANPGKLLLRLLSYIFKNYGFACIVVVVRHCSALYRLCKRA